MFIAFELLLRILVHFKASIDFYCHKSYRIVPYAGIQDLLSGADVEDFGCGISGLLFELAKAGRFNVGVFGVYEP